MKNIEEDATLEPHISLTQKERYIAGLLLLTLTAIMALYYLYG